MTHMVLTLTYLAWVHKLEVLANHLHRIILMTPGPEVKSEVTDKMAAKVLD